MQDSNHMTPIKKQQQQLQINPQSNKEGINEMLNSIHGVINPVIGVNGNTVIGNSNISNPFNVNSNQQHINSSTIFKQMDKEKDTIFCPINDPIFQPTPSPNLLLEYKNYNPYYNSSLKGNNMLASTLKPYNNNLFLTPIKEDDQFKPTYINSILKESPYFNGNNICRKLNFDEDFEEMRGNNFMPLSSIFEEKKGIFSNYNINYLLMPQAYSHYRNQSDYQNSSIHCMDSQGTNKAFLSSFLSTSPYNKKVAHSNYEMLQSQNQLDEEGKFMNEQKQQNKNNKDTVLERNGESSQRTSKQDNTADFTQNIQSLNIPGIIHNNMNQQQTSKTNKQFISSNTNAIVSQSNNTPTPSLAHGSNQKKQKTCNCKKTKCLKLYCDCFAAGELCGGECNCFGCFNTSNSEKRAGAIVSIMDRLPDAFGPKVEQNSHKKGCNCARSGCQKKYCECYTLGIACGEYCKCTQCKNIVDNYDRRDKIQNQNISLPIETSKKISFDQRKQTLDQVEQQSSNKKKIFLSSTSQYLARNISQFNDEQSEETGNERYGEEQLNSGSNNYSTIISKQYKILINGKEHIDEEQEKYDNNQEDSIDEEEQMSISQKMYTTPMKQAKKSVERNFTTADTSKKQSHQLHYNDSDIKERIVKLQITENPSPIKKSFQKSNKLTASNIQNYLISSHGSDEENLVSKNPEEIKITQKKITIIPKPTKTAVKQ